MSKETVTKTTTTETETGCDNKDVYISKLEDISDHHLKAYRDGTCLDPECPIAALRRLDLNVQETVNLARKHESYFLDTFTILKSHGEILTSLADTQKRYMGAIARNTKHIATNLGEYNKQNQRLVPMLSGKKQVPISVFLVILLSLGVVTIMMFAAFTHYQLVLDESQISVTKQLESAEGKPNAVATRQAEINKKLDDLGNK